MMLEVTGLLKTYRLRDRQRSFVMDLIRPRRISKEAVKDVTFSAQPGECVAYVGPNGSGKTTTIKCIAGVIQPDAGTVRVKGLTISKDRAAYLRRLGVLFSQRTGLFADLPVTDTLEYLKVVYTIPHADFKRRVTELADSLQATELLRRQARTLSLGERMRCELLAVLLHSPELVILDEPTVGLDIMAKEALLTTLRRFIREEGATVLITSHNIPDLEQLCSRVLLLAEGRLIHNGTFAGLRRAIGAPVEVTVEMDAHERTGVLEALGTVRRAGPGTYQISVDSDRVASVYAALQGLPLRSILIKEAAIEEVVRRVFSNHELLETDPPAVPAASSL